MKDLKHLFLSVCLAFTGSACIDDGSSPEPKPDEEVDTGSVEQASCATGTYYNQCREYTSGTLWNQAGCSNQYRQNYYGDCEQYKVGTLWRHEGCSATQSYFCTTLQFPALPSKCQPQCP